MIAIENLQLLCILGADTWDQALDAHLWLLWKYILSNTASKKSAHIPQTASLEPCAPQNICCRSPATTLGFKTSWPVLGLDDCFLKTMWSDFKPIWPDSIIFDLILSLGKLISRLCDLTVRERIDIAQLIDTDLMSSLWELSSRTSDLTSSLGDMISRLCDLISRLYDLTVRGWIGPAQLINKSLIQDQLQASVVASSFLALEKHKSTNCHNSVELTGNSRESICYA